MRARLVLSRDGCRNISLRQRLFGPWQDIACTFTVGEIIQSTHDFGMIVQASMVGQRRDYLISVSHLLLGLGDGLAFEEEAVDIATERSDHCTHFGRPPTNVAPHGALFKRRL